MHFKMPRPAVFTAALALVFALMPGGASVAQQVPTGSIAGSIAADPPGTTAGNAACPGEDVFYNPSHGEDIVVPQGYKVDVFAKNLNFPTSVAFMRTGSGKSDFNVLVVESGTGLPGRCNNNDARDPVTGAPIFGGKFSSTNPFTPDILVLNSKGNTVAGPFFKPTATGGGYQPDGPAIGIAFQHGDHGTLFVTDSNQGIRGAPGRGNNTSRIMTADIATNTLKPFIVNLPTGDHPTEMLQVKDGFLFWSQGSATNAGVTGHDNGAGGNQHDIPCQDIRLSNNVFDSGDGHLTSGFSNHGVSRPGAVVRAFEGAANKPGTNEPMHVCTGAIMRTRIDDPINSMEPFSSGYRNPFGLRFAPKDHPLKGGLFVTVNGEDERGARPTNGAPDRLDLAQMNPDGTPDFHGWPDRFGFLDSGQLTFQPQGGPADDNPAAVVKKPVQHVLAFPPQPPTNPLSVETADVAVVQPDFAPNSFVHGVVRKGAALIAREGDFGFSPEQSEPGVGHDIELVNFSEPGKPLQLQQSRFAFNCPKANQTHLLNGAAACKKDPKNLASADIGGDQAFVDQLSGINRPVSVFFGPDDALYLVDYGAVRDFGQSTEGRARFTKPADAPLVQIPHTGVIWRISRA